MRRGAALAALAGPAALALAIGAGCSTLDYGALDDAHGKGVRPDASAPGDGARGDGAGGDGAGSVLDAGDAGAASDAEASAPRCTPSRPFDSATATSLGHINDSNTNEVAARLTPDERTLYFSRDDGTGNRWQIYVSTRASTSDPFDTASAVSELDDAGTVNTDPMLLRDGVTMYFTSNRGLDAGDSAIFVAIRPDVGSPFGAAQQVELSGVPTTRSLGNPYMLPDDVTLYFADEYDSRVYRAIRSGTTFELATAALPPTGSGQSPVVTSDERTLYYVNTAVTGDQLWTAAGTGGKFTGPQPLAGFGQKGSPLGTLAPTWISDDGCRLYFSAVTGSGSADLYVVSRPM